MDFSFNEEKMKKVCHKLIRISNLGEKTLKGYIEGGGFSPKDYSITERAFLEAVSKKLQPSTYPMVDVFEVERVLSFYKTQIIQLFENRTTNYVFSDNEWWCAEEFDCFDAIRNERMYLSDFYKFATEKLDKVVPVLVSLPLHIYKDYQFCQGMPYNFASYFLCQSLLNSASTMISACDLLCGCITKWVISSLPTVFSSESEDGNSQKILQTIISSPSYMKEFINYSCYSLAYEQINCGKKFENIDWCN